MVGLQCTNRKLIGLRELKRFACLVYKLYTIFTSHMLHILCYSSLSSYNDVSEYISGIS